MIAGRRSYPESRQVPKQVPEEQSTSKSAWRICQSDPKIPPADKQSVQVKQKNRKRRQHWHRTHQKYSIQFAKIVPPNRSRAPRTLQQIFPPDPPRPLRTATELGVTHPVTRWYF